MANSLSYWFILQKSKHQWDAAIFHVATGGHPRKFFGSRHCSIRIGRFENSIQSDMATS